MRVAVIGSGTMGGFHARALGAMDEVTALFVVDADATRAERVAADAGGRAVDVATAIAEAEAVIIATPPELHREAAEAALDAGRSVLCEKPLTDALASTIALTRRAETGRAHLEIGFHRRHDQAFAEARRAVADGSTGRIHLLAMTANDPLVAPHAPLVGPPPEAAPSFRDSSIHDFDLARFLTGQEVVEVSVEAGRRDGLPAADPREIERAVTVMRFSGRTIAVLTTSWLNPAGYDARIELLAEQTVLSAGLSPRTPLRHLSWPNVTGDPWNGYLQRFTDAYCAELGAFLAAVRGERLPATSARDGLEAMRIAVAATRSHVEHRRVSLDEVEGLARVEVA
jgi:myo-inositol 2-dehydrogenase / D-chiro-inositol 1-dehydrogenase